MVSSSKAASWSDLCLKQTAGGSNADQTAAVAGGRPGQAGIRSSLALVSQEYVAVLLLSYNNVIKK